MEPSGRQQVAAGGKRDAAKTAQEVENRCRGLRPVHDSAVAYTLRHQPVGAGNSVRSRSVKCGGSIGVSGGRVGL